MKATNNKKIEIAKEIAAKVERQLDENSMPNYIVMNKGTLKELCRMVRRIKVEEDRDNT